MNHFKTFLLMAGLVMLFMFVGSIFGGESGMIIAALIAIAMNFFMYWFSDKMVLAQYKAQPLSEKDGHKVYEAVRRLSITAGLPMPKVYIVDEPSPNAFATGRNPENAVVAVTTGLLNTLSQRELEAVLAHELSHIKHRDMLTGTIAATAAGAITMLASMGRFAMIFGGRNDDEEGGGLGALLMLLLAPIAATLIQLMISRSMEYKADTEAARITGRPQDLISALENIHGMHKKGLPTHATEATQHLLIANPFTFEGIMSLFSTHPTLEQRRRNLLNFKP